VSDIGGADAVDREPVHSVEWPDLLPSGRRKATAAGRPERTARERKPADFLHTARMFIEEASLIFFAGCVILLAWFLGMKCGICPARPGCARKKKERQPYLDPVEQMRIQREQQRSALGLGTEYEDAEDKAAERTGGVVGDSPPAADEELELDVEFRQASDLKNERIQVVFTTLSNAEKLNVYAMFKQASEGDVTGDRPGMFDIVGRAKFDAWAELQGMSCDEAKRTFIGKVSETAPGWKEAAAAS